MVEASLGPLLISLFIVVVSIPPLIRIAALKHLMDEPDTDRKWHKCNTPLLGGVAIFAGTMVSYSAFRDYLRLDEVSFIVPSLILLFFTGVKDDILVLTAWKKMAMQVCCALLICWFGGIRVTSLWGIFGIWELPFMVGTLLALVLIVSLINAFNFIDGIDGLAGAMGAIAATFFGLWFLFTGKFSYSILAFSLLGSLLGFLFFNLPKPRIFMGDTGSMVIGFVISILAIKFVEANRVADFQDAPLYVRAAPGVALAAVLIPFVDMARVFFCRVINLKNPLRADRRHIHHILLDLGFSDVYATLTLTIFSALLLGLSLLLRNLRSWEVLSILFFIYLVFVQTLVWRKKSLRLLLSSRIEASS